MNDIPRAASWIWLSIAAAVATMALKAYAAVASGSVGFLSDAMESVVNLVAAVVTLVALRWSESPPDEEHPFGHAKGELLAALAEGVLVTLAGVAIVVASIERMLHPVVVASSAGALAASTVATAINAAVGLTLLRIGKRAQSAALTADGHHLLTDVWTSLAVMAGVGLMWLTGRAWLDAAVAAVVALLVLRTGWRILHDALGGLVDRRLPPERALIVHQALEPFVAQGVRCGEIRTRQAGREMFINLSIQVPGAWTVRAGHDVAHAIEDAVAARLPRARVETHVEPIEDVAIAR